MNNLIILCNPKESSFCESMANSVMEKCQQKNIPTVLNDLYKIDFNPVITSDDLKKIDESNFPKDIEKQHELIRWADILTFIFPIYWAGMPALMKGYIDRVICKNFAYKYTDYGIKGLLTDKKVIILNSYGNSFEHYSSTNMFKSLDRTIDQGIFNFCGLKILNHSFFGSIHKVEEEKRCEYLNEVESLIDTLL